MALIGQVQNVAVILQGISSGLFSTAAVKYSAEWKEQPERLHRFLSLSYTLVFWITLAVGTGTVALSWWLAKILLNGTGYWWVFAMLGLTIPLFATNSLMLAVINGLGNVRKLTLVNVGQSIFGLVISVGLPLLFGLAGALAATVLASAVVFLLLLRELRLHTWLKLRAVSLAQDGDDLRRLKGFALMAITSAVCAPLAQLFVREWIVERCSIQEAGYWQALMRLSGAYLAFFITTLSVYFLPKFSAQDDAGVKQELRRGYFLLLPALVAAFGSFWLARATVIRWLFTEEFMPLEDILGWQLAGDFLKMGSWVMSYVLLAKARTTLFIVGEIGFSILYVLLTIALVGRSGSGGALGAVKAWICLYALYWVYVAALLPTCFRKPVRAVDP